MKNFIFASVSSLSLVVSFAAMGKDMTKQAHVHPKAHTTHDRVMKQTQLHHQHTGHPHSHMVRTDNTQVGFPPVDQCGKPMCEPSYYADRSDCPYKEHGGYYWYPHAEADKVQGYRPYQDQNMYWYASRMHPERVYGRNEPLELVNPSPMDEPLHDMLDAPMEQKFEGAPMRAPADSI